jgi:hypothetical protein
LRSRDPPARNLRRNSSEGLLAAAVERIAFAGQPQWPAGRIVSAGRSDGVCLTKDDSVESVNTLGGAVGPLVLRSRLEAQWSQRLSAPRSSHRCTAIPTSSDCCPDRTNRSWRAAYHYRFPLHGTPPTTSSPACLSKSNPSSDSLTQRQGHMVLAPKRANWQCCCLEGGITPRKGDEEPWPVDLR